MKQKELSVVFLMWVPYGIEYFRSFLNSYLLFPAGTDHELVILFNGYESDKNLQDYHELLRSAGISYYHLKLEQGQDIFAYKWSAEQLSSTYVLFLNTYSQILNENWGKYYLDAIRKENVGCVGATGSWQSRASYGVKRVRWLFSKEEKIIQNVPYYVEKEFKIAGLTISLSPRLALLASFLKSLKDIFHFPFFPNPHLRTNAFITNRLFWLSLHFNSLKSKKDAYRMESGNNSFTRQIIKLDKKVQVINREGKVFEPYAWDRSKTLWYGDQEDLMISDNFTMLYEIQNKATRLTMQKSIWGSSVNDVTSADKIK
jgi:hypothetical protein